jgi:hypothetical protein
MPAWALGTARQRSREQDYLCSSHSIAHDHAQVAWITPSELFTPAYGAALGAVILQRHAGAAAPQPLRIVEVGGGNGTLAKDILVRSSAEWASGCQPPHPCPAGVFDGAPVWLLHNMLQSCSPSARSLVGYSHRRALVLVLSQDHVRSEEPEAYGSCGYTTVEISGALAERQRQRVAASGHADRCCPPFYPASSCPT